ncbi:MFS transporter [Purpureocillium lilacinum]|uniref:MFS transporter n=1 Tax=Purpureocillium lilacinum TaxID=33203 RepID=A0A179HIZ6_PURLI|nr:MFS transporter [Purpureocillium lilacinum]OAQ90426.1 MFS transporter [Purpureocillium lilacinum]
MAEQENKPTMDPTPAAVDGAADNDVAIEKEQLQHLDRASTKDGPRPFQAPEIIRSMSPEDRDAFEKKLVRKIDLRLLPMIILMYILNYIDRNNIASARLAGLEDDLKLNESGTQFNTAVSILFVGYLLMQVPSNLLLNKMGKPGKYLPACMAVWGIISTATAACHSFGGLVAARFFLGFVEAAYFPGCLYYLSCWYTRKELSVRTTYLYAGSLISGAFSGLIAAGITSNMDGAKGLRAWRWLFIIEGAITIVVAIAAFWILPDFPRTTKWLDEKETALAAWRLEEDIGQDDWVSSEEQTFWHGFKLALEDVKMWVLLVLLFGNISAASITNFFPTVVATLKYSNVITLLLTAPPYCLGVITTFANAWHADRTGERFYHITLPLCLAMVTFIIAAATTNTAARYTAMMLMIPGLYSGFTTALAWISNTLPRPPAKRAAALAFINAVGNATSIYTAYLYPKSAKPGYTGAFIHNCVLCAVAIAAAFVLKLMLVRLNKKLDRGERVEGAINAAPGEAVEHGFRFLV